MIIDCDFTFVPFAAVKAGDLVRLRTPSGASLGLAVLPINRRSLAVLFVGKYGDDGGFLDD